MASRPRGACMAQRDDKANDKMRKAGWFVVILVLIVAGWTSAWFYAAGAAGHRVDAWIAAEAALGRFWTCPNRSVGGFPFAIKTACSDATFAAQARGQGVEGSIAHVAAETSLLHPRRVDITLGPPFAYRTSDGQTDLKATWASLTIDIERFQEVGALSLRGTDVAIDGVFGQAGQQTGTAARLDMSFTLPRDRTQPTMAFTIAVDGAPIAPLDEFAGGNDPSDIDLVGRIDLSDLGDARTPEEALERWRQAGGRIDLGPSSITRGGSKVIASGTLRLDDAHRPQGRLDAQFVGVGPLLARYGISGNLAAAGSLLSSLFGGGARPPAPSEPGALALPISLQDGRLGIGPIRTQIALPALY